MQPGERLNGIQEVSGSIPLISTKGKDTSKDVSFFFAISGQNRVKNSHFFLFDNKKCSLLSTEDHFRPETLALKKIRFYWDFNWDSWDWVFGWFGIWMIYLMTAENFLKKCSHRHSNVWLQL